MGPCLTSFPAAGLETTLREPLPPAKLQGWNYFLHFIRNRWQFPALSFALRCLRPAMSVRAPHRPAFLLTVSCELLSSEGGRAFLGVEIVGWKPSSATQRLSWQGQLCSDPGQTQSVLMPNGENRVTSLLLPQSHTYPPAQPSWAHRVFNEDMGLSHFSSSYLGSEKRTLV